MSVQAGCALKEEMGDVVGSVQRMGGCYMAGDNDGTDLQFVVFSNNSRLPSATTCTRKSTSSLTIAAFCWKFIFLALQGYSLLCAVRLELSFKVLSRRPSE